MNTAVIKIGEEEYGIVLNAKTFKTKSVGFYGNGKAEFGGKRYQVAVQLVEIGSKPK